MHRLSGGDYRGVHRGVHLMPLSFPRIDDATGWPIVTYHQTSVAEFQLPSPGRQR